ncbi:phosphoglycerate mutase (2,3-diphosphoglycerate-independent) [Flavobacteriaceae bacterium UJ101]|nr:phosphoglycerate mutase (2,3-diphosphoglycerate-independent) [Flavobacteriaceae bacterium UJ101]
MNKKVLLMILDGWGFAKDKKVSAVDLANTPFIDSLYTQYPNSQLEASGLQVGLPEGQMGNSEVGHMNLGAGRIVYQNLVKIGMALENGSIKDNKVFKETFTLAKKENKRIHFIGLTSDGGVHSHINHLKGLLKIASEEKLENVYIHAFTDGRDVDPKSGKHFIQDLIDTTNKTTGKLATITGRYYAMDRDRRWNRVKLAYDAMVNGIGLKTDDPISAIENFYQEDITDEFLKPIVVTEDQKPVATIQEGDIVINFNFRTDRGRQISMALTQENFLNPKEHNQDASYPSDMKKLDLYYVTMTEYDQSFKNVHVIFDSSLLKNTLGEVLEQHNKKQIRIAETEKYPHVTFFFSGGQEEEFKGEKRILCNSPQDVATYDLKPEMAAYDIKNAIIPELEKQEVDFICLNFANPDMVGHTGVMEAAIKACEVVDECAQQVTKSALQNNYTTIIIADHGNADCLVNPDGSPNTAHTTQPVPCILVDQNYTKSIKDGKLGDIAPTILELIGIEQPEEMTGVSLL